MKRTIFLVLVVIVLSWAASRTFGQTIAVSQPIEPDADAKRKEHPVTISNRSSFSKEFDAPNGITLIHKPTVANFTKLKTEREFKRFGKMKFEFVGTLATPNDFNMSDSYGSLEITSTKKFKKFDVGLKTSYHHSQLNPFAIAGLEFSKGFNETEDETKANDDFKARIFSNTSYYTTTQSNRHMSSAWVLRNGMEAEFAYKRIRFEVLGQVIGDFGAIRPGRRLSLNTEVACLMPVYGSLYVGPKFGYARYLILNQHDDHFKSNKPNIGIEFAYFL